VAFLEAKSDKFKEYQKQIVKNSRRFAKSLKSKGFRIVSGGTDNHMFLVDLTGKMISGKDAQVLLENVNITLNKNLIPYDPLPPQQASGVRIGTPAVTTRGISEPQIDSIACFIDEAIKFRGDLKKLKEIKSGVLELTDKFPLYPELKGMIE
jgi:glycine hydroxymethyltransferase